MPVLESLLSAIRAATIEVVDLTARLEPATAANRLPEPFGAGKYGLTQLQNLSMLPATGAVVIAGPLPIAGGSGSPCRALALVERS